MTLLKIDEIQCSYQIIKYICFSLYNKRSQISFQIPRFHMVPAHFTGNTTEEISGNRDKRTDNIYNMY